MSVFIAAGAVCALIGFAVNLWNHDLGSAGWALAAACSQVQTMVVIERWRAADTKRRSR